MLLSDRQKQLTNELDAAARAYYQENREIMSNKEYDELYDELAELERQSKIVLSKSPTLHPGYEILSSLPTVRHPSPMLSLDKTKDVEALRSFLGSQRGVLSWKLDGLTVVLTYEGGSLFQAVTRGNGVTGEVVTANARQFVNVPGKIPFDGRLVLRGEALISYADFERINAQNPDADAKYKNPRNLCAGSVRQLNSAVTAKRCVRFIAFALVSAEGGTDTPDFENSREKQFEWLEAQGFDVVERRLCDSKSLSECVRDFASRVDHFYLPSDGLVLLMDDIAYGDSLGSTAKFPRNAMAYKWKDETAKTVLRDIHWSPSRTGLINPVAVFDPVELEGTTVTRASVHNISIVEALKLGVGDEILVYKANMIIPQIAENLTKSANAVIPQKCPVCGAPTSIKENDGVKTLFCENDECAAKRVKAFELFVSRDAMNAEGLSGATMEKFIDSGFIHEFADIFELSSHRKEICEMEGFGEKSYANIINSVEKARKATVAAFIYSLGIPGIGSANAKVLARAFNNDFEAFRTADEETLTQVDGIGPVMAQAVVSYFSDKKKSAAVNRLLDKVTLEMPETREGAYLDGKTFVITGSVEHFAGRSALKAWLEERGAKVAGSVSARTSYLINNDTASASAKNKKAKELGIPVLDEEALLKLCKKLEDN